MRRNICYILYKEEGENSQKDWINIKNERFNITIMKINPYKFHGICGQRYNELYVDAQFTQSSTGNELINEIFKPMAAFKDAIFSLI